MASYLNIVLWNNEYLKIVYVPTAVISIADEISESKLSF